MVSNVSKYIGRTVAQWKSAWLKIEGLWARASPVSLRCVLEQDTLNLAEYWLNPGRPSRHN